MLDIRKEMEGVSEIGGEAIYPEVVIDEDELSEECKLLEIKCENEQCPEANNDEVQEKQSDELVVQPLAGQPAEGSKTSKAEVKNIIGEYLQESENVSKLIC